MPPRPPRRPPAKPSAAGTREEYTLLAPLLPGVRPTLVYTRTGRAPSWCNAGVCTLEVRSRRTRPSLLGGGERRPRLAWVARTAELAQERREAVAAEEPLGRARRRFLLF